MKLSDRLSRFIGLQSDVVYSEKIVASLGGLLAIFMTYYVSFYFTGREGSMAILPSMGAATVLLFAVPHGQLSTPWALFGGNLLSAIVGVTAVLTISDTYVAAGVAVGLSVLVMHMARCLHPPGGATALAAVIGGSSLQELGYWYVLTPTLINCLILFVTAVAFNNLFHWRRYPLSFMKYQPASNRTNVKKIETRHIHEAVSMSGVVVDINDEQLKRIFDLADKLMNMESLSGFEFEVGAFYTNGLPGIHGSIRQIVDERSHQDPQKHMIIFRTVEGANKGFSDSCSLQEFAQWASKKLNSSSQSG